MAVADDADGIASALDTAGEQRVVRNHRARPDHDAGEAVSCFVDMAARRLARHPSAVARVRRDLAVERHGVFEHDKWGFLRDVVEEHLVPLAALGLAHAGFYLDARVPENFCALSGNEGVGVEAADKHAADTVLDDGIRAGRRAPPVTARLKRDVKVGSGCIFRAVREGVALGVQAADVLVPALADDASVLHDDAADHRIGVGMSRAARGKLERPVHEIFFLILHEITSVKIKTPRRRSVSERNAR